MTIISAIETSTADVTGDAELDAALTILRVAVGAMIFVHGYRKAFVGAGLSGTTGWFHSIGMRPARIHAWLAIATEMIAGVCLILGLATSFASACLIGIMVVAFWIVHRDKGFMITDEGWEYVAMIAVLGVVIAMTGPGGWSLDAVFDIDTQFSGWLGLAIAVTAGLVSGVGLLLLFYRPSKVSETSEA